MSCIVGFLWYSSSAKMLEQQLVYCTAEHTVELRRQSLCWHHCTSDELPVDDSPRVPSKCQWMPFVCHICQKWLLRLNVFALVVLLCGATCRFGCSPCMLVIFNRRFCWIPIKDYIDCLIPNWFRYVVKSCKMLHMSIDACHQTLCNK